jgi:endonuclease YncB( thermonuclease family)
MLIIVLKQQFQSYQKHFKAKNNKIYIYIMDIEKLRVRKISKQEKYKIYNTDTKEVYDTYQSRMIAHKVLEELKNNANEFSKNFIAEKKGVKFDESVIIVHIKDGENIKEQIKEQIKK